AVYRELHAADPERALSITEPRVGKDVADHLGGGETLGSLQKQFRYVPGQGTIVPEGGTVAPELYGLSGPRKEGGAASNPSFPTSESPRDACNQAGSVPTTPGFLPADTGQPFTPYFLPSKNTEKPAVPLPISEEAYIGPVGDYVRAVLPHTEASAEAILLQ